MISQNDYLMLANLAGVTIKPQVLKQVLLLLELGYAPGALFKALQYICLCQQAKSRQ